jgi:phasin
MGCENRVVKVSASNTAAGCVVADHGARDFCHRQPAVYAVSPAEGTVIARGLSDDLFVRTVKSSFSGDLLAVAPGASFLASKSGRRKSGQIQQRRGGGNVVSSQSKREDGNMIEPKLEVPAELRDLAEKTIDQAEKAFGMFFDAANKSMTSVPGLGTEISKQALTFTEQNMKAAFEHARKLVHATDLQQAIQIQSEFLRSQFTNAGEHMRQITGGVMSAAKNASKGQP